MAEAMHATVQLGRLISDRTFGRLSLDKQAHHLNICVDGLQCQAPQRQALDEMRCRQVAGQQTYIWRQPAGAGSYDWTWWRVLEAFQEASKLTLFLDRDDSNGGFALTGTSRSICDNISFEHCIIWSYNRLCFMLCPRSANSSQVSVLFPRLNFGSRTFFCVQESSPTPSHVVSFRLLPL